MTVCPQNSLPFGLFACLRWRAAAAVRVSGELVRAKRLSRTGGAACTGVELAFLRFLLPTPQLGGGVLVVLLVRGAVAVLGRCGRGWNLLLNKFEAKKGAFSTFSAVFQGGLGGALS